MTAGLGPDGIEKALAVLAGGGSIDAHAASGQAVFDAQYHARPAQAEVYCWDNPQFGSDVSIAGTFQDGGFDSLGAACAKGSFDAANDQ